MMINKKVCLVIFFSLILGGCSITAKPADLSTGNPDEVISGTLVKSEVGYLLEKSDGTGNVELDARNVKLDGKEGTMVTVKGQFSGTTLFVDSVQ